MFRYWADGLHGQLNLNFQLMDSFTQPSYHCVANLGDVNPVEHGGKFLCIDRRGIYAPTLIIFEPDPNDEIHKWTRHDIELEQCHRIFSDSSPVRVPIEVNDGVIGVGDNGFHPNLFAWFGDKDSLKSVASFSGTDFRDFVDQLCSLNAIQRAQGYIALASFYGEESFDNYPCVYSEKRKAEAFCRKMLAQIKVSETWWNGLYLVDDGSD